MKEHKTNVLFLRLSKSFPGLKLKLKQAGMDDRPEYFVNKTFISAFYMTAGLYSVTFLVLAKYGYFKAVFLLFVPVTLAVLFFYMLRLPDVRILKKEKEVSKEIVFVGRFVIIELESGVPLYNAMINVGKNFDITGTYFKEIVDKVDLGTSMEDALNEAVELVPSNDLRKILWQVINSLRTGADVAKSLYSVIDNITKEQVTEINKYGKKLNPLAMFYMMVAVILPSLGVTMLIILSSFIQFQLSLTILMVLAAGLGLVQLMFISMIKFSRPAAEF